MPQSTHLNPGSITTFTVVSVLSTGTGTAVLAANPSRKSAFFQNLGSNLITLGPDNAGMWAPATGTGIQISGGQTPPTSITDLTSKDAWRAIATTGTTSLLVMEIQ